MLRKTILVWSLIMFPRLAIREENHGLRLIDEFHYGRNIVDHVPSVPEDYGLCDKVFYWFGQYISSYYCHLKLKPTLSAYVGNLFLYQRYAFHITNLIIKAALEDIKAFLESHYYGLFLKLF